VRSESELVTVPATIRAGDTIEWVQPPVALLSGETASAPNWGLVYYLRTNMAAEGATIGGTARADGGWDLAISAGVSAGFDAGRWYWQARVSRDGEVTTIATGSSDVLPSLAYSGTPAALDGRSKAEQDLDAVQAAIRALVTRGAKAYSIGGRSWTSNDLGLLMQREAQLKAVVARERSAETVAAGLGDPGNVFVRFG
jgi:hypothetical protein